MRKLFTNILLIVALVLSSCAYDDTAVWNKLENHESRISALEELCREMNTNISALQSLVDAMQGGDYITSIVPVTKDGNTIGYTITFAENDPITIYHGTNGKDGANGADGKDGYTPIIGVKQDSDGIYYWTLDGEWLLDDNGNKIKAVGTDGKDGQDGANGADGKDGHDGVTPRLKIENDYWYVSYDNGTTWTELGKATGENDDAGNDEDSLIADITVGEDSVTFTLADGTVIILPLAGAEGGDDSGDIVAGSNKIYYTTADNKKMFPTSTEPSVFGAIFISNVYKDGQGVLTFDDTITSIGKNAFYNCTALTSITIPDSVTSIGDYAFYDCSSLTNVTIGNGVTSIGKRAFGGCDSLTSVTIPDSVTSIGERAFYNCTSLTSVTIGSGVTSIGKEAFYDCTGELIINSKIIETDYSSNNYPAYSSSGWLYESRFTKLAIGDNITKIGYYTFYNCHSLTSVTIGSGVTSIGDSAFYWCDSLTSVIIPDSVTKIGDEAFYKCTSLTSVIIGNSVTSIGDYAFAACDSLTSVTIPDSVTSIGGRAFYGCDSLTSVYCKAATPPSLGEYAFKCNDDGSWNVVNIGCTIYVPTASVEAYKSAAYWSDYKNYIVGYEF